LSLGNTFISSEGHQKNFPASFAPTLMARDSFGAVRLAAACPIWLRRRVPNMVGPRPHCRFSTRFRFMFQGGTQFFSTHFLPNFPKSDQISSFFPEIGQGFHLQWNLCTFINPFRLKNPGKS